MNRWVCFEKLNRSGRRNIKVHIIFWQIIFLPFYLGESGEAALKIGPEQVDKKTIQGLLTFFDSSSFVDGNPVLSVLCYNAANPDLHFWEEY